MVAHLGVVAIPHSHNFSHSFSGCTIDGETREKSLVRPAIEYRGQLIFADSGPTTHRAKMTSMRHLEWVVGWIESALPVS